MFVMIGSVVKQVQKKGTNKMLNKIKNQENVIMMFFVVTLILVGVYSIFNREIIDVIYFVVLMYYFWRFLMIRKNGK